MKPLDTHAPKHADTAITRLKLKDQLAVDPYKGLALLESTLLCLVTTALMLFVAQSVGITDTFKSNVLYGGTLGGCIGAMYRMYHDAALSESSIARHISPTALQNAMLALKYSETQEGVYYPKNAYSPHSIGAIQSGSRSPHWMGARASQAPISS